MNGLRSIAKSSKPYGMPIIYCLYAQIAIRNWMLWPTQLRWIGLDVFCVFLQFIHFIQFLLEMQDHRLSVYSGNDKENLFQPKNPIRSGVAKTLIVFNWLMMDARCYGCTEFSFATRETNCLKCNGLFHFCDNCGLCNRCGRDLPNQIEKALVTNLQNSPHPDQSKSKSNSNSNSNSKSKSNSKTKK